MPEDHSPPARHAALFAEHRPYLFAVAYRMLGVAEDAEDVLQDAWLRFAGVSSGDLDQPRAYLVTVVTRLCVDLLRSARHRREEYVGVWLPEPVPSHEALPDELAAATESASFAFLLLLERLSPIQRAVLVLHDAFDYSHAEIAVAVDRTVANCRQILRRARLALGRSLPPESEATPQSRELVRQFVTATSSGDLQDLLATLAPDVVLLGDGGGLVTTVRHPMVGRSRVGRFFDGVSRKASWGPVITTELNHQPAILVFERGALTNAMVFDTTQDGITAVYVVRNPHKLRRLTQLHRGSLQTGTTDHG